MWSSSPPALLLLLTVFVVGWKTQRSSAARIGLFGSSGCYSHSVLMRAVGEVFEGDDVSWIQTYTFDFGVPPPTLPSHWNQMIFDQVSDDSISALQYIKQVMWEATVPLDARQWWDWRPQLATFNVLRVQHMACYQTLKSANFTALLQQNANLDLAVVDYMLQECMITTASLFNASASIYFANWPLADLYIQSLNVPWLPSTVPKCATGFPTQMNFNERSKNMAWHLYYFIARTIQLALSDAIHDWAGYKTDVVHYESRQLFFAAHSEFILDLVRPISNQIKFFGCQRCRPTHRVKAVRQSNDTQGDGLQSLPLPSSGPKEIRGIDHRLLLRPFIVVTFGSISTAQTMGTKLLNDFMRAFGALNHTIFWQFDGMPPADQRVPNNVHLYSWLPMKELFDHPNMQLLVTHGGITTLQEAVLRGIPILGVPLQGDQPTNIRRYQEQGLTELVFTDVLSRETLLAALNKMLVNIHVYKERALKLGAMVEDYHEFAGDRQEFWLQWAVRNGPAARQRNYFTQRYFSTWLHYNAPELFSLLAVVTLLLLLVASDESDQRSSSSSSSRLSLARVFPRLSVHFDDSTSLAVDEAPLLYR